MIHEMNNQMPRQQKQSSKGGGGGGGKGKRVRTIFTAEQLKHLENFFSHGMYLSAYTRQQMAASLGLTEAQVKVWFQNRRIKERKMNPPMFMATTKPPQQQQQQQQQQPQQPQQQFSTNTTQNMDLTSNQPNDNYNNLINHSLSHIHINHSQANQGQKNG